MTRDQELWGVALAIERQHGDGADLHIAKQIERMIELGDDAGMQMWLTVSYRLEELQRKTDSVATIN